VIWHGAPIHRAQVVKDFLAQGAAARLQWERVPGYAPELHPAEGIWRYLKHIELRNDCCDDLPELRGEVRLAVKRLRHKRHVLRGCLAQCGDDLSERLRPTPQARPTVATTTPSGLMPLDWVYIIVQRSAAQRDPLHCPSVGQFTALSIAKRGS
jgi:hypothetical protein